MKCLCFPIFSPYYGNSLFPYFGKCMDFCFTQNIWETHKFEMFVFSHTSFVPWKSTFPIFSKMHGFLLQAKNLSNPLTLKCLFSHTFFLTMGINFSHIFGIVWINASHEICQKLIALECLCFPICFPYYENLVFPCYRNCMGFY